MADAAPSADFHFRTHVETDANGVKVIVASFDPPDWFAKLLPSGVQNSFWMGTLPLKVAQTSRPLWVEWVRLMARCVEHMVQEALGEKIELDVDAALRSQKLDG